MQIRYQTGLVVDRDKPWNYYMTCVHESRIPIIFIKRYLIWLNSIVTKCVMAHHILDIIFLVYGMLKWVYTEDDILKILGSILDLCF